MDGMTAGILCQAGNSFIFKGLFLPSGIQSTSYRPFSPNSFACQGLQRNSNMTNTETNVNAIESYQKLKVLVPKKGISLASFASRGGVAMAISVDYRRHFRRRQQGRVASRQTAHAIAQVALPGRGRYTRPFHRRQL